MFFAKEFRSFWYETGTPTFLVKRLKAMDFDVRKFTDRTLYASESVLKNYSDDNPDPIPLLYQTGYLTIADYDPDGREYTLAFPNNEVKYGFLESLMPEYVSDCGSGSGIDVFTLRRVYYSRRNREHKECALGTVRKDNLYQQRHSL